MERVERGIKRVDDDERREGRNDRRDERGSD